MADLIWYRDVHRAEKYVGQGGQATGTVGRAVLLCVCVGGRRWGTHAQFSLGGVSRDVPLSYET